MYLFFLQIVLLSFVFSSVSFSSDPKIAESETPQTPSLKSGQLSEPARARSTSKKERKGRISNGKEEAEGTHAPNRFDADITIKSQYRHNGQELEVDTD